MRLIAEMGEDGLIKAIAEKFSDMLPAGIEGIGDDCAVIPVGEGRSMLVTTDTLTSGVHFLESHIPPNDLGYKSLAVNLSDIAAMGGDPKYAFLNLSLPKTIEIKWIEQFFDGLHQLAKEFGIGLLGGDTTAALQNIFINLTVVGYANNNHIKRRCTAKPGDLVLVTKPLGDSAAGLKCILEKLEGGELESTLIGRHYRPAPEVEVGKWLGRQNAVTAMMDLSDGLSVDLTRLAGASKCKIAVDLEKVPVSLELTKFCSKINANQLDFSVFGGEDYALVFCVEANGLAKVIQEFKIKFKREVYQIGRIISGNGLEYLRDGAKMDLKQSAYSHF